MTSFLITSTNATCALPEAQRELFKGAEELVTSTEGWEPGALNLAQGLAMKLSTPLIHGEVSRLLIDLNEAGEKRWSKISGKLPEQTKEKLVERHQQKFRSAIINRLTEDLKRYDEIVHLMVHTAPIADGKILVEYGNSNHVEKIARSIAGKLPATEVETSCQPLALRTPFMNWMRSTFPSKKYDMIQLTVSQSFFMKSVPMRWETIKKNLIQATVDSF